MTRRQGRVLAAALGLSLWAASITTPMSIADPAFPYPKGTSDQTYEGRQFEIYIPDEIYDPASGHSLIVTITGGVSALTHLGLYGYIIVAPRSKSGSPTSWSASESKDIHALTKYLIKQLGIAAHRVHAVGTNEIQGVFAMAAFGKTSPFVSATFVESAYGGGSVSGHLKKKMGVLAFDWDGTHSAGIKTIEHKLVGQVRTVELRKDPGGLASDYFRYWVGVMEGRFEPGYDLSFAWETGPEAAKDIPALVKARDKGALVYFWSPQDKANTNAQALQNEVFLDPRVREHGRALIPIMLNREDHPTLFTALTLQKTPAVAVVDRKGKTKLFQGKVKASALARCLKKAAK